MTAAGRVAADERGARPTLEEIEIGKEIGPVEWTVTEADIDGCCLAHDDYHEWYSVDSPFSGRVAPPWISYPVVRETFKKVYRVRGLFVGWSSEQHDVIRPNEKMTWHGRISDKYVKRDREWVWYEFVCTGADGREIMRTKRGHVLDFLPITTPKVALLTGGYAAPGEAAPPAAAYGPPIVTPKKAADLSRASEAPIWNERTADRDTPLGTRLRPESQQMSARFGRDYYELMMAAYMPKEWREHNIHTDPELAKKEGLAAPNAGGPQFSGTISRMMLRFLGEGWLKGSRFDLRVIKQVGHEDFVTAKGFVTGKELEGGSVRLLCNVWVENQKGEKVVVGTASGPVPA